MPSKIFIASLEEQGSPARKGALPLGAIKVDRRCCQAKNHPNRVAFSPMHIRNGVLYTDPAGYKWACFENAWQSGTNDGRMKTARRCHTKR